MKLNKTLKQVLPILIVGLMWAFFNMLRYGLYMTKQILNVVVVTMIEFIFLIIIYESIKHLVNL